VIASTPVGRWTWGRSDDARDLLAVCLHNHLVAYSVLATHRLASGAPKVHLSVTELRKANTYLFNDELTVTATTQSPAEDAEQFAHQIRAALRPGEIGSVDASTSCVGVLVGPAEETLQDGLFRLSTSAFDDFVTVGLVTSSDAWLPYDLKGQAQPAVHAANAPRLATALDGLADALGSETDPDDPTYFGEPTETGIDNRFDDDGTPSDAWSRFEIPARYEVFHHAPPFRAGYQRTASGEVQYLSVQGGHGTLGYLWVSDTENAASFEPRDAAEEGYEAGLRWLDRLQEAYTSGLSPTEALAACAGQPADALAGHVLQGQRPQRIALHDLRNLARDDT
jgi:hypothetical protein